MNNKWFQISLATIASFGVFSNIQSSIAQEFSEEEVSQDSFIAVAIPFGYKEHRLELIEQISGGQQCWNESGNTPVTVDLLLLNFDHTDSCRRIKDSNGYSIRLDGNGEKSSLYLISLVQRNGELQAIAKHENPNLPELVIGRSQGIAEGTIKINLEPGWKITKRSYQGKTLGHVYLSGNSQIIAANQNNGSSSRQGLPIPSSEVAGTYQVFQSDLSGCDAGNYRVKGRFDTSLTQLTITDAPGAEGCFDSLPVTVFNTPNLVDNGEPIEFTSSAAPGMGQMNGSVRRVHGSFTTPITYANAKDTIGLLAVNSNNIVVKDPTGDTINENTTIITKIPAPSKLPISEVLPDLIPGSSSEDKVIRDTNPDSDTNGALVVRDRIDVVFYPDTTVGEINNAVEAIGGGIIGSFEGGTVVTIQIPDTGNLDGLNNAENILSTQPSVVTPVRVVILEPPIKEGFSLEDPDRVTNPCPTGDLVPQYLEVLEAFDNTGNRPSGLGLGTGAVNLFVVDFFSNPNHDDVNLVNPIQRVPSGVSPIRVQNPVFPLTAQVRNKGYVCDKFGLGCKQKPEKVNKRTPPLDPDGDPNVALFRKDNATDENDTDGIQNYHGYLVSGILAARQNNNCGIEGMYPDNNARIFAFNAARDNYRNVLFHTLQNVDGNHVVNLSLGVNTSTGAPISQDQSDTYGVLWATIIQQRNLEDRVVFVQSAGNSSTDAERNGLLTASALKDNTERKVIDRKEEHCRGFLKVDCKVKIIKRDFNLEIPRLTNALVVEALDATGTGDYTSYSNIAINQDFVVRALGDTKTTCPLPAAANVTNNVGFPALSANNELVCQGRTTQRRAPGGGFINTIHNGGTSSAAPQVAGLAAWLWSRESNLTAGNVVDRIRDNQSTFQPLDAMGNPQVKADGTPEESVREAINVVETLTPPGTPLTSCPNNKLGTINISTSFESEEFVGGTSELAEINSDGIVRPGRNNQVDLKPALEEFGFNPDEFLSGEYGEEFIDVDYDLNGSVESIRLEEIPESCS